MKKSLTILFLATVLMTSGARAADKIAYVDLQEVFRRFYKTQLAADQVRQQAEDIKLERDDLNEEVADMKKEIEALRTDSRDDTLSEEVRENKRNLLEEKLVELQKKEQDGIEFEKLRMKQRDQQKKRMNVKLLDEIYETVINYAKMERFTAVVDRSSQSRNGTPSILYVSPEVDITADILEVMNEGRKGTNVAEPEFKVKKKAGE